MQRSQRSSHASRDVTDDQLADSVNFVQWTEDKLHTAVAGVLHYAARYDQLTLTQPVSNIYDWLLAAAPTTLELGDGGGFLFFYPLLKGHEAQLHIQIHDPMYMRRVPLIQAALRFAFKTWNLRRITAAVSTDHTLVRRLAERVGFKPEGTQRQALVYSKGVGDRVLYGLLREEV